MKTLKLLTCIVLTGISQAASVEQCIDQNGNPTSSIWWEDTVGVHVEFDQESGVLKCGPLRLELGDSPPPAVDEAFRNNEFTSSTCPDSLAESWDGVSITHSGSTIYITIAPYTKYGRGCSQAFETFNLFPW